MMHIGWIALVALGITSSKGAEADVLIDKLTTCHSIADQACLVAAARLALLEDEALPQLQRRFWALPSDAQLLALGVVDGNEGARATDLLVSISKDRRAHATVRALALDSLGSRRYPRIVQLLTRATRDKADIVRVAAVRGLSNHMYKGDAPIFGTLLRLADDPSPSVRVEVLFGLGFSGNARAASPLEKGLTDADPKVRRAAAEGLGLIKHPGAIDELVALLDDKDDRTVQAVVRALRYQTDQDFGADARRWKQWLADRR